MCGAYFKLNYLVNFNLPILQNALKNNWCGKLFSSMRVRRTRQYQSGWN